MRHITLILLIALLGCGSDGEQQMATTQAEATTCGDVSVDLEAVDEIIAAALEEGVDVEEESSEPSVDEEETLPLQQDVLKNGAIIVICGGTVATDDSTTTTNTAINGTTRALNTIYSGRASRIIVKK